VILAIDQGTTGTTCLVFDSEGRIAGRGYSEFEQHFPQPGWVEHDAAEIWQTTRKVGSRRSPTPSSRLGPRGAIGITNQRETVVAWDPGPASRSTRARLAGPSHGRRCDELREAGREPLVRERTGLVIDPTSPAPRLSG